MITPNELSDKLGQLGREAAALTNRQVAATEILFEAQSQVVAAKSALITDRAAAIAQKEIQAKEHGTNQSLRDAHEKEYLKEQYAAVADAEQKETNARHDLDLIMQLYSLVKLQIGLTKAQVSLAVLTGNTDD